MLTYWKNIDDPKDWDTANVFSNKCFSIPWIIILKFTKYLVCFPFLTQSVLDGCCHLNINVKQVAVSQNPALHNGRNCFRWEHWVRFIYRYEMKSDDWGNKKIPDRWDYEKCYVIEPYVCYK